MLRPLLRRVYHRTTEVPVLGTLALVLLNVYRRLQGRPQVMRVERRLVETLPEMPDRDLYDRLAALNAVDTVQAVTTDFYDRLGLGPDDGPLMARLAAARHALSPGDIDIDRARRDGSILVRFEAAWQLFLNGDRARALVDFEALLGNDALVGRARRNVYLREALVRSAEMVARHAELAGDVDKAILLYQRVMAINPRGVIARRLSLLLWRQGRLREAGVWAERALWSDQNLASPSAKHNPHLRRAVELLAAPDDQPARARD